MSVEVKTPTREQFEHSEFPCPSSSIGVRPGLSPAKAKPKGPVGIRAASATRPGPTTSQDDFQVGLQHEDPDHFARVRRGSLSRKRRSSDKPANLNPFLFNTKKRARARRNSEKEKIVLPSKFLNGGTITDPLNLSGPGNEALNENTPVSSPLPIPVHKSEVKVLLPPNITDPLALNAQGESVGLVSPKMGPGKKKKKHRKKKSTDAVEEAESMETSTDVTKALTVETPGEPHTSPPAAASAAAATSSSTESLESKLKKIADAIVSPALPQLSPKLKRGKRTLSESSAASGRTLSREDSDRSTKAHRRTRYKRQGSNMSTQSAGPSHQPPRVSAGAKRASKFIYGNYDRYYGYRNPDTEFDPRLQCLQSDWFENRHVLDVGCNVGHLTLAIARDLKPKRIVGIDIDHKLISGAKKNVRHLLSKAVADIASFPASLSLVHGPIAAPPLMSCKEQKATSEQFPHNVMFMQGNYVMEKDEQVERQQEEYDAILFFSISKWIHLNWGDAGLKRAFRRVFKQLRPGGHFILEPQSWTSYKRRTKLNETIHENYKSIQFKPDQFTDYLLSPAVGFSQCRQLDVPPNRSKGFQRPMFVYTKSAPSPYYLMTTPSASSTPGTLPGRSRVTAVHFDIGSVTPHSSPCVNIPTTASPVKQETETSVNVNENTRDVTSSSSSNTSSSSSSEGGALNGTTQENNQDLSADVAKEFNGVDHSGDE
ncbi:hypothetical protein CAPTEDRAFT_150016 [Capitella teleta]|uniref:RNA methyltransferase n=1 Tax=Capitella teleta TaxID=283909 RepID=R7UM19_CAPTE|nr:hypothetical protein CAPTEDRAFT_150016 [Capitella teleta]|eukprot:ELU07128.1 hypothetical protein CAPTEDRAFT_150016 [Capitella teleta]